MAASSSCTASGRPCSIGVRKRPGAIVQTRIPRGANSLASGRVIDTMAPVDRMIRRLSAIEASGVEETGYLLMRRTRPEAISRCYIVLNTS